MFLKGISTHNNLVRANLRPALHGFTAGISKGPVHSFANFAFMRSSMASLSISR